MGSGELRLTLELDVLPALALDAMLMRTVVVNLLRNACQAMPDGGELLVRTHKVGQGVYLRVRDQGPGIALEDREKVFDPLYTTRAEGTGLGLAICHKSITAHGGKLSVRDAPGGGAEVVVRIPLVVASPAAPSAPAVAGGA
jgi:signal transduction histidine kinase